MQREIALDTETTGLDPESGHRIVEIGCVEMIGRVRSGKSFHRYLNPERDVPEEAFRVHGLSRDFLAGKPKFAEIAEELLAFLGDAPLVIHNAAFDMRFLNSELIRTGRAAFAMVRATDTVAMARKKFPGAPASLDALCKRYEIDLSARTRHGALLDAELLAEVYLELTGGRQAALALTRLNRENAVSRQEEGIRTTVKPREFPLTADEIQAHRQFLSQLKKPLWEHYLVEESPG